MAGFMMAEDPRESERLFLSMSHPELVANCLNAQRIVAEQIEQAAAARRTVRETRDKLVRLAGILRSAAGQKGRRRRVARDEAMLEASNVLDLIVREASPGRPGGVVREFGEREVAR